MAVEIDIAHVARLARLDLSESEMEHYRGQLGVILEHAARVGELEGDPVVEVAHPLGMTNNFRPDEVTPSLDRQEVLDAAPDASQGYFVVPPALES